MIKKEESKADRIEKLIEALGRFVNDEDNRVLIQQWDDFVNLSASKRAEIASAWEKYYEKVKTDTWHGRMLVKCGELLKKGDIASLIRISKELKQRKADSIERPPGEDPAYLKYKLGNFLMRRAELKRLKEETSEELLVETKKNLI